MRTDSDDSSGARLPKVRTDSHAAAPDSRERATSTSMAVIPHTKYLLEIDAAGLIGFEATLRLTPASWSGDVTRKPPLQRWLSPFYDFALFLQLAIEVIPASR